MIDTEEFRKAIRSFTTGVTIVTVATGQDNAMHGMTASSFASVSVKPQLVSINVEKTANAHPFMVKADRFTINILTEAQLDLASYFAGRTPGIRREARYHWFDGWPILDESLGYFACKKWAQYDGGDHTIFVGEAMSLVRTDERPLLHSRGRFHTIGQQIMNIPDKGQAA